MLYNMYSKWRQMGFLDINIIYNNSILWLNLRKSKQKVRILWLFCDKCVSTSYFESVNMSECLFRSKGD